MVFLAEGPEIHRLRPLEIGNPDQVACLDLEARACARGHMVGLAHRCHVGHRSASLSRSPTIQLVGSMSIRERRS